MGGQDHETSNCANVLQINRNIFIKNVELVQKLFLNETVVLGFLFLIKAVKKGFSPPKSLRSAKTLEKWYLALVKF